MSIRSITSDNLVIIPVFNERETLGTVLDNSRAHHSGDILAVDDGSTDGSDIILDVSADALVIRHNENLGYGQSLIDGFNFAIDNGYKLAITMDCDEQHEPNLIPSMFDGIGDHDVLSGSRYLQSYTNDDSAPLDRREINIKTTEIINEITGYGITDSFCGFKCYRVSALAKLDLSEPGYAQPLQFWVQAKIARLDIVEMSVPRIYKNINRSFGEKLDNPVSRINHYLDVLTLELDKYNIPVPDSVLQITKSQFDQE